VSALQQGTPRAVLDAPPLWPLADARGAIARRALREVGTGSSAGRSAAGGNLRVVHFRGGLTVRVRAYLDSAMVTRLFEENPIA
jgi:hypothetical protein